MTIALDPVRQIGEVTLAAVVERKVHALDAGRMPSFHGAKRPVAVLVRKHNITCAYEPDGTPLPIEVFDSRYPGQRARFEAKTG